MLSVKHLRAATWSGRSAKELRAKGIKVGLYYSLLDWSHTDYPNFTKTQKRYTDDSLRWARFTEFNLGQIEEISTKFKPDLIWFDGDWEQSAKDWHAAEIREMLINTNTNTKIIINSRLAGYGDYATPEQGIPVSKPKDEYWELCMTMNDSWGYQQNDRNYKSANLVIRIFADVIGMGGNLLLDIGPSTLSADSTILYLFIPNNRTIEQSNLSPTVLQSYSPTVLIKGITNKINAIWIVGNGTKLEQTTWLKPWWSGNPGLIEIEVPAEAMDNEMTVIAVLLEGKIQLKF